MKKLSIRNYDDYRLFMKDYYETNKQKPHFSFRYIANKLNWPHSLYHDVINKRKELSMSRAVELAKFLELDTIDTDYFILLILKNSKNEDLKEYSKKKLETNYDSTSRVSPLPDYSKIVYDIKCIAIVEIIEMYKGKIKTEKIQEELYTLKLTHKEIEEKLNFLQEEKVIFYNREENLWRIGTTNRFLDEPGSRRGMLVHKEYATNLISYIDNLGLVQKKGTVNSGFFKVHRDDFEEIKKKIFALRNSFEYYEKEAVSRKNYNPKETILYQFDLNLFPISLNSSYQEPERI